MTVVSPFLSALKICLTPLSSVGTKFACSRLRAFVQNDQHHHFDGLYKMVIDVN